MSTTLLKVAADFEQALNAQVTAGDTTATLSSADDTTGTALAAGLYGFTIDGDNQYKEYIVCSLSGTALTNVMSVSPQGVATTGFSEYHRKGASVVITDWASISRITNNLNGTTGFDSGTNLGYDGAPSGLTGNQFATVNYVLSVVNGGAVTFDRQVLTNQTAGENLTANDIVYLKEADNKWWKVDDDLSATFTQVRLGVAQATTLANASLTIGISGPMSSFSGLSAGVKYYVSSTAGAITTSAGKNGIFVGWAISTTVLFFSPQSVFTPNKASVDFLASVTGMILPYGGSAAPTGFLLCDGSAVSRTTYANLFAVISTTFGVGDGSTTFNVPNLASRTIIGAGTGTKVLTFSSRSSDTITVTGSANSATNEVQTGQAFVYTTTGTVITGLTSGVTYYLIRVAYNQFKLATSLANAVAGTAISLSSSGTGTQLFTSTLEARTAGDTGGEETHAETIAEMASHTHTMLTATSTNGTPQNRVSGNAGGTNNADTFASDATGGSGAGNNMPPFLAIKYIIKT